MPHPSEPRLLALHGVRLKGIASPEAVAALWQLDAADVETELKAQGAAGLLHHRDGQVTGWALTPEGRAEHAELVAAELEAAGARPVVEAAYQDFLDVNPELLAVCTSWQLTDTPTGQVLNDHADAGYDDGVIVRLGELDDRVGPVLDDLAGALERFGRYRPRLAQARQLVEQGERQWFTKPLLDSYHTVWFELHEDLLSTLGLQRGSEVREGTR